MQHPSQPDPKLLDRLAWIHSGCLAAVSLIAMVNLSGWLFPALDPVMFRGWMLMKANTGLLLLLSSLSLICSQEQRKERTILIGLSLGAFVFLVAGTVLIEYSFHVSLGLDTLLAADAGSSPPGRMAPQTAASFALLGIVMTFIRVTSGLGGLLIDLFACGLGSLILLVAAGYAYGVLHLFGLTHSTLTAPQTLLSLTLLFFVVLGRRAERGVLSIFVGSGVGSGIARIAAPMSLLIPFMLEAGQSHILQTGSISPEYSAALVTVLAALMGVGVILTLGWRIDGLEQNIRDLSLRDDLTKLFNRRGFFLLAKRGLQHAHRSGTPFSVLFIDLDNLKQVNDTFGHETGSALLREFADLLTKTFRETEVLGRVGGDEFVVAGDLSEAGISLAALRLEKATEQRNLQGGHRLTLSFSLGSATSDSHRRESLEDLMTRADTAMYAAKRSKKLKHHS